MLGCHAHALRGHAESATIIGITCPGFMQMSEPRHLPAQAELADTSGKRTTASLADSNTRLVRCCCFTLIVALILTSRSHVSAMSNAEQEMVKLRNMAGYLKVDDENLLYAIAIETG